METNNEPKRPSLLKQLLGAAGGAAVALLLYQGYKIGAPVVTAWLVAPQSQISADHPGAVRANREVSEYEFNRLAAKAKEIYKKFAAEPGPQAEISRTGIEVTQPAAAQSSSIAHVDLADLVAVQQSSASSIVSSAVSLAASSGVSFSSVSSIVAEPVAVAASSARARAEIQAQSKLAGTKLPNSGIGTTLAAALAFGAAAVLRKKRGSR
ncbi:MAG: hypothetical protein PHX87_00245 [Candidatus Peribacteraceae bacterium]|nr:hypothetical protein [Candidatus Peribacteraceae bacterium]MDD5741838.1 hypothetical protein [Candidatus Peribacteraceae bacterium]